MRISLWHILISITICTAGCGPSFSANTYGRFRLTGSSAGGPIVSEPTLPVGSNILKNESFNQDLTDWEDWGNATVLGGGAFSGGKGLRISGANSGGLGQEVLYRIKTGGVYTLKAQAKVADLTDEVYLGVRFFDLNNGTFSDQKVRIASTGYTLHTVQITVPKGASSAKVYVWKVSAMNSFADFDDFTMTLNAMPPAPAKEPTISNPTNLQPTGPSGTYALVFNENFNGTTLDTATWNTGLWFNTTINNELQAYRPENVSVSAGSLLLKAEARSANTTWGDPKNYASGAITTKDRFAFTMGVVEARMKLPRGAGLHSAFYLEPYEKRAPPEINILSALGQSYTTAGFSYRFYDINGVVRALTGSTSSADYSADYHTFTVEWSPSAVRFYVDGALRGSYSGESILRDDVFIVLNLAIGGSIAGGVSATFPQILDVDYIRVWQ